MAHGPSRGELRFRLVASLLGLALMAAALVWRRDALRGSVAVFEVVIFASLFFGGTALWTARRLMRRE